MNQYALIKLCNDQNFQYLVINKFDCFKVTCPYFNANIRQLLVWIVVLMLHILFSWSSSGIFSTQTSVEVPEMFVTETEVSAYDFQPSVLGGSQIRTCLKLYQICQQSEAMRGLSSETKWKHCDHQG